MDPAKRTVTLPSCGVCVSVFVCVCVYEKENRHNSLLLSVEPEPEVAAEPEVVASEPEPEPEAEPEPVETPEVGIGQVDYFATISGTGPNFTQLFLCALSILILCKIFQVKVEIVKKRLHILLISETLGP